MNAVTQACPTWQLEYGDLDDAIEHLARAWPAVVERGQAEGVVPAESGEGP